nr:hypothetical protein [Tanacetum cinerariifolium]
KVSLTARVESLDDEESLGKDASKQGRIKAIDTNEEITLVNDQHDADKDMFDVNVLGGEEVFVAKQEVEQEEPGESTTTTTTIPKQQSRDKGKGIMIKEPVKPKKKDQIRLDKEAAKRLQAEFDEKARLEREKAKKEQEANIALIETWDDTKAKINNIEGYKLKDLKLKEFDKIQEMFDRAFGRVNTFKDFRTKLVKGKEKRAREELIQESTKKQKVEDKKETTKLKQLIEILPHKEEVTIDAIPLAVKSPRIVDWKIHKEIKKSYYQIVRADGKSQMYMVFSKMRECFDREDLKDLYKLVKAKFKSTRPVEDLDLLLYGDLKTVFEPHGKDKVWKLQQGYKVLN